MSKKLDEDAMLNELSASAFFKPNTGTPSEDAEGPTGATAPTASLRTGSPFDEGKVGIAEAPRRDKATVSTVAPPARPFDRTPVRRPITRYAFEFYQDQIERLRRISLHQKLLGQDGSMSVMVRQALEDYLAARDGNGG